MSVSPLSTSSTASSVAGSGFSGERDTSFASSLPRPESSSSRATSSKPSPEIVNADAEKLSKTPPPDHPPEHGKLVRKAPTSDKPRMFFPPSLRLTELPPQESSVPFPNSSFPMSGPPPLIRAPSTYTPVRSSDSTASTGFNRTGSLSLETSSKTDLTPVIEVEEADDSDEDDLSIYRSGLEKIENLWIAGQLDLRDGESF